MVCLAASARPDAALAQGNEKPPPPDVGSILPGVQDPQQAGIDTVVKRESLPPLALPDIVVFGRATSMMRDGSKLFSADKRTALDREIAAPTGDKVASRTGWGGGRMLAAGESTTPLNQARAWLHGGSFGEVVAGVDYWRERDRWRLVADGGAARSGGHLDDSAYLSGFGALTGIYSLGHSSEARLSANYAGGTQEEWGAGLAGPGIPGAPVGAERGWFENDYSLSIESALRRGLTVQGGFGGRHAGLTDEIRLPGTVLRPRSNGGWAEAGLSWLTGRTLVSLMAGIEGDRLSGPAPAQTTRLSTAEFAVQIMFSGGTSVTLGGIGYLLNGGLGETARVWPTARFSAQYSERFSMFVRDRPRIDYLRLGEAHLENRFVANTYQVVPREERFHLAVGLRYTISRETSLEFEVRRRLFDRLPVWRRAPLTETESDGLFVLDGLASIGLNETVVMLEGRPTDNLDLDLTVLYRTSTGGGIQELPHLPDFAVRGTVSFQGPWRVSTTLHLQHLADRYGDVAGGDDRRLDSASDLGARFAFPVTGAVTAWLELRNLLGQKMVLWEGYPMPGRATAIGISVRF
jgi:hypothetical protein